MNWGTKIALFYSFFVVAMLSAVIFASMQSFYLVSPTYYQEELAYESKIQQLSHAQNLEGEILFSKVESGLWELRFPQDQHIEQGSIQFFRPSDARLDTRYELKLEENQQLFQLDGLVKGNWNYQLSWTDGQQEYYQEEKITL